MKLRILKPVCPDVAQILPISLRPFVDARYETKPLKMPYIYICIYVYTHIHEINIVLLVRLK